MERALASLAILKVEWDRGRDYIDCFVPFVAESLRSMNAREISLPGLQADITKRFHITIPQGALRTILNRSAKHGYVSFQEGIILASESKLRQVHLSKDSTETLRMVNGLIHSLAEYAQRQFETPWSAEDAESAILHYLQAGSIPILAASVEGTPITPPAKKITHSQFIVNSFVVAIQESDNESFDALSTLVKGNMLTNVLYYPELGQISRRFTNVEFYLDTSVLLRSMGLATKSEELARREMIDLLYSLNAPIRCFEHTVREVRGVLSAAASALRNPKSLRRSHGEAIEYFISTGCTASDVELFIAKLERFMRDIHVHIVPTPPHLERLGLDESQFEAILYDQVGYAREETLRHDLDAISAIHRLRTGDFPQDFESSSAIFVTDNHSLVRASAIYFRQDFGDQAVVVPHCLPYHLVTTLAWLKKPSLAPDLPRRLIIADCYAALNPPDTLWRLYLQEIDSLQGKGTIADDDYHLLRFSSEARALLMSKTLGDPAAFAEGTVAEVLDAAKREIRRESEKRLREERRRRRRSDRARYRAIRAAEETRASLEFRVNSVCGRVAAIGSGALFALGLAVQLGFAALLFPGLTHPLDPLWRTSLSVIFILSSIWAIYNASTGRSLATLVKQFEVGLGKRLSISAMSFLMPQDDRDAEDEVARTDQLDAD